eukprot:Nitzschia sp. Nitz4//scaffold102_size76354//11660//12715//NITZ4_005625-RA/size76354-processed-gene-0.15-mRNA-1//1//CDS//3329532228//5911//frame0
MERALFQKALEGFVIPPRSFLQLFISGAKGTWSLLFDENCRQEYIHMIDDGIINQEALGQASMGSMFIVSLYNDLNNPLFKQHNFDAKEFLGGVGPALQRYHNVSGSLANQLSAQFEEMEKKKKEEAAIESDNKETVKAEETKPLDEEAKLREEIMASFPGALVDESLENEKLLNEILDHDWMEDVKKDPESLQGQLHNMLTEEFFNIQQLHAKTSFLLQQATNKTSFKEDSCSVNGVALLSARSFVCVEPDHPENIDAWGDRPPGKYELVEYEMEDSEIKRRKGGVAAQLEVLYEVSQEYMYQNAAKGEETVTDKFLAVAVMEGWLQGGPEGSLRWRLALHRPAVEFPDY